MQVLRVLLILSIYLCITPTNGQPPISQQVSELYEIITQKRADDGSLNRFYINRHSPERIERFQRHYESYLTELESYDFDALSQAGKVDYLLFKRDLQNQHDQLTEQMMIYEQVKSWLQPGEKSYPVEIQRRRGEQLDHPAVAATLHEIIQDIHTKNERLEEQDPFLTMVEKRYLQRALGDQIKTLQHVYEFYDGYDPLFNWWVDRPYAELIPLMEGYRDRFDDMVDPASQIEDDGSGILGSPIGREALIDLLSYEMIPYTPEELMQIAEREFAWCDQELLKASQEMGYDDDWRAAQEYVKQQYVPVGQQPEAMHELYVQSIDFLKKNELLTIPPLAEETWRMTMLSPERQRIAPFFLGGEVLQIAYPTDDMTHEEKLMSMRGNNPHFNRATVHHELIAGHHLQQFMNRRNKEYRNFRTPFWTEGWALYWEMVLWDEDFPRGPEDRIGMLFWRMHRCARIIFSLKYHLREWTPQECIDFLVDRVGHERSTAEGEVRRSFTAGYGPLYQLAYMTGGLQFRALKEELVDSGKMSYREFHDAVMRENAMPIEMLRALLTDQKLSEDFQSSWRFYNLD